MSATSAAGIGGGEGQAGTGIGSNVATNRVIVHAFEQEDNTCSICLNTLFQEDTTSPTTNTATNMNSHRHSGSNSICTDPTCNMRDIETGHKDKTVPLLSTNTRNNNNNNNIHNNNTNNHSNSSGSGILSGPVEYITQGFRSLFSYRSSSAYTPLNSNDNNNVNSNRNSSVMRESLLISPSTYHSLPPPHDNTTVEEARTSTYYPFSSRSSEGDSNPRPSAGSDLRATSLPTELHGTNTSGGGSGAGVASPVFHAGGIGCNTNNNITMKKVIQLQCHHTFHQVCILQCATSNTNSVCPVCRHSLK